MRGSGGHAEMVAEENKQIFEANRPGNIPRSKSSSAGKTANKVLGDGNRHPLWMDNQMS
jgi:hypothetical protein